MRSESILIKKSFYRQFVSIDQSTSNIMNDPFLTDQEKNNSIRVLHGGMAQTKSPMTGMLSTGDIVRGAIGAGVGSMAAKYVGTVLGGTFGGLSPSTLNKVQNAGMFAGMLRGAGVWK